MFHFGSLQVQENCVGLRFVWNESGGICLYVLSLCLMEVTTAIGVGVITLTENVPECKREEKMLYMLRSFSFSDSCPKKNLFFSFLPCLFSLGEEKQVKKRVWKEGESIKWLNEAT